MRVVFTKCQILGVLFTLLGTATVVGGLGAALGYWVCAIRPRKRSCRRANHLFLAALACAAAVVLLLVLASFAMDAGLHFMTDRPQ